MKKLLAILMVSTLFTQLNALASSTHNHSEMKKSKPKTDKREMIVEDRMVFKKALKKYEVLHKAFFNSDMKLARDHSKSLVKILDKLEDDKVSKLFEFSIKNAKEMEFIGKREDNNKRLNYISKAFLYVLSKYKVTEDYAEYYCPMVKKTWIQNTMVHTKVRNPYSADMPGCGEKK